ncbi:hypothetical protein [Rubricoccus marinus]|uniref:Uncharacterized protein n=1 Tax=Rubricoccus marinus TaxID=716817 RepID=A0A259TXZ2_9BACT|nr:hypothetical protein [Rubricoccus marinus]OZC02645.1 hypothetical protein BSZ36_06455 [Rubricoccus marinus]
MASGVLLSRLAPLALAFLVAGCSSAPPVVSVPSPRPPSLEGQPEPDAAPSANRLPNAEDAFEPPPPPDPPVPADSLANRLLDVAMVEARESIKQYNNVVVIALEESADAQSRARRKALEAALAAERAETLMRVRFALLGGIPMEAEGEMRLYLSFLSVAADDLLELDVIDGNTFLVGLEEVTTPLLDAMRRVKDNPDAP